MAVAAAGQIYVIGGLANEVFPSDCSGAECPTSLASVEAYAP